MGRATLKPVQIDTSLYSRKSPKLTHSSEIEKVEISIFYFLNFKTSEVEMANMLLERLVGKNKNLESFKLEI